jgi:D-alanyl-D-alanine carboxypeptidase (penicillin-binding protein 5/6)
MSLAPGRIVGIIVGALAILGIGVYGPAMLLGPLPDVTVKVEGAADAAGEPSAPIVLPGTGANALAVIADDGSAETLAIGGEAGVVPIGGAAKLVAVLATLESLPLPDEGAGPGIPIGPADYTDYLKYSGEGSRTLQVSPGETWTERDVVRAVLLASSNNHADTLVRWAFGGVEPYVAAANEWLAENGFESTRVDDATGLSGDNVGTAEELTRLVALALADPEIAEIFDGSATPTPTPGTRNVPDIAAHLEGDGVRSISRSFTDQAGLCLLFTAEIPGAEGDEPRRIVGAMLRMPDYETLDPAVLAALESTKVAAQPITVITSGTAYAEVEAPWGDRGELVASTTRTAVAWGTALGETSVTVEPFSTAAKGRDVGRAAVPTATGEIASPLELSADIRDPGPLWRLSHPVELISAFVADQER